VIEEPFTQAKSTRIKAQIVAFSKETFKSVLKNGPGIADLST
jgi:hypothetical protein